MVVVFFGKRNSGKTTLCRNFYQWVRSNTPLRVHYIDNDKFRFIFSMKSVDTKSEIELLEKASVIAKYEQSLNDLVLMSMSFAFENLRKKLSNENKVMWVYTTHTSEKRPSNKKDLDEFEEPENVFTINTDNLTPDESLNLVIEKYKEFCLLSHKKSNYAH
jgi:tRNA uridine 5-carbamoylmethylation protein Kti12